MLSFNRRSFLSKTAATAAGLFASTLEPAWSRNLKRALEDATDIQPDAIAGDEAFWKYVQRSYTVHPKIINLNNAGIGPAPKPVHKAMKRFSDFSNEVPTFNMWRVLDKSREPLRKDLARVAGCSEEEIAIQRNASEALETIIFGLDLKKGDEVVLSTHDYPNMINAWKQREMRDGIKLIWIDLILPSEDTEYMVNAFTSAFTRATRVVHITHVINWNGQILPVRRIADNAHRKGIEVVVDGAHSFAQLDFTIPSTGADYFGSSLHKWLSASIGSGLLYVKKEKIKNLYPLFANEDPKRDNIRKFEHLGTRPFFIEQSIRTAISFHEMIGIKRKEERLFYLNNYWMCRVKDMPGVSLRSPMKKGFASAIGLINVEVRTLVELNAYLYKNYNIHAVIIQAQSIQGVRITPNVYTTTKNLDSLVEAIGKFTKGK